MMTSEAPVNNAFAMSLIESKLNELIGQPSGYYDTLPRQIKKRVSALKNIQWEQASIELELKEEILALEKRFHERLLPLYQKRTQIIQGKYEPNDDECKPRDPPEEQDDDEVAEEEKEQEDEAPTDPGIPEFWATVLKGNPGTDPLITPEDEDALKHCVDIRYSYLKDGEHGFRLEFEFSPNDYFEDSVITKTYYLKKSDLDKDFIMDKSVASEIHWKKDKNLGFKTVTKTQRKPGTNKTRTIKKSVPKETFFNFFKSLSLDDDDEDDEEAEDEEDYSLEEKLQADFSLGDELKSRIIPKAVDWFTGEALEEYGDDEDEEDYDDEDEEGAGGYPGEDDEDDEEEDDVKITSSSNNAKESSVGDSSKVQPECKQQ